MAGEPAYILEIRGVTDDAHAPATREVGGGSRWIGIHFECCGIYNRIYRNRQRTAYVGHCPRCQQRVQVLIGPGGTSNRMFRAY